MKNLNKKNKYIAGPVLLVVSLLGAACTQTTEVNGHTLIEKEDGVLEGKNNVFYRPDGTAYRTRVNRATLEVSIFEYVCSQEDKVRTEKDAQQDMKTDDKLKIEVFNLNLPNRNRGACGYDKEFIEPGALEPKED
ncbi:MAG: hypothetical protein H6799_02495 [Candidatus Nomurabacteria bacterium]|nr:MAG: hypothetical protein H6799_02495 [Candidatus Nomurabacteria bacterium]